MDIVERLKTAGADDSDGQSTFAALEREAADEIVRLREKLAQLERGEYICKSCGLRKDGEHPKGDF